MKPSVVIIGLGNPGASYERTRHNLGFRAVERLAEAFGTGEWKPQQKFLCEACEGRIVTAPVLLAKPRTYMNLSIDCVRKLVEFYKLDPASQLLILCDDIDLPLGDIRVRMRGGPGTHNGLRPIVDQLGEHFPRIRIGLGSPPAGADLAAWVLSVPSPDEEKTLAAALEGLPALVEKVMIDSARL